MPEKQLRCWHRVAQQIGITYKLNGNVLRNEDEIELTVEEMENTPYPAYELLPSSNPYTQLPVETSRGCRFSCAFCSIPHRRNWRGLSVEHVIKRVKHALQFKDIPIMNGHFFNALYIAFNCSATLLNSLGISNSFTPLVI